MTKITEKEWLVIMQEIHLEMIEWMVKEIKFIPKEIQRINDRTSAHIAQLRQLLKAIHHNIETISLHRAKKELGIDIEYNVDKNGRPNFNHKTESEFNNGGMVI